MTTMLSDPPVKTTMGVGFAANRSRSSANQEAWRRAIGTKPVAARLELLPEGKPRWNRIGLSAIVQVIAICFVLLVPLLYPERIKTVLHMDIVQLAQPVIEIPVAPPPPKVRAKTPPPTPKPVVEPLKLNPQQPHIFVTQKVVQPKIQKVEAKAPDLAPVLEAAKIDTSTNQPKRPREDVKMNNLNSGSAAPATVIAPVNKVQTGGFGDPNGVPGEGDPKKSTNMNRLGSPALPGGPRLRQRNRRRQGHSRNGGEHGFWKRNRQSSAGRRQKRHRGSPPALPIKAWRPKAPRKRPTQRPAARRRYHSRQAPARIYRGRT